jgi:hypothetical protein
MGASYLSERLGHRVGLPHFKPAKVANEGVELLRMSGDLVLLPEQFVPDLGELPGPLSSGLVVVTAWGKEQQLPTRPFPKSGLPRHSQFQN